MKNNTVRIIKKYQNRRLYDVATSSYIVLDRIKEIIIEGETIQVIDSKTNADVTRNILLQIIAAEEINGIPLLSNEFLINIISLYGKYIRFSLNPFLMYALELCRTMVKELYSKMKIPDSSNPTSINFWQEFIKCQPQLFENNIKDVIENNTNLLLQFQEEIRKQTLNMFDYINFPFKNKDRI